MMSMCSQLGQEDGPAVSLVEGMITARYASLPPLPFLQVCSQAGRWWWHRSTDHDRIALPSLLPPAPSACRCAAGLDDGGGPSGYRQDRHGSTDYERAVPQLSRSAHAADYALQPGAERPVPEDYAAGYSVQIPAATGWVLQRA